MPKSKPVQERHRLSFRRRLQLEMLEDRRLLAGSLELLKDIHPNLQTESGMARPFQFGDKLYFVRSSELYGSELWVSDGKAEGTAILKDISPGAAWPSDSSLEHVTHLTNVDGTLFFRASDGMHGFELWKSDGTSEGTQLVKDIRPGRDSSIAFSVSTSGLTNVNGNLFFSADDGLNGMELWKSDGTQQGTVRVKDIVPGAASSNPRSLINVNGTLYFQADDAVLGAELWKSDGTTEGTVIVKDIRVGGSGSFPSNLSNIGGTLFFSATDGALGYELWKSNGTSAGTVLVKDIRAGGASYPSNLINVDGTLFFRANDGASGYELWKSDGSTAGTLLVKDIASGYAASSPQQFTNISGNLFFSANDGTAGMELWKSDGSPEGTVPVKDIRPGSPSSEVGSLTNVGGTLYFVANDGTHGLELWKSNGTSAGTNLVKDISNNLTILYPTALYNFGGTLHFSAEGDIWKSDGTEMGTTVVKSAISEGTFFGSTPKFSLTGDSYTFGADDGIHGFELWRTDGTSTGTVLVRDIRPGGERSLPDSQQSAEWNGQVLLLANDGASGYELWRSDGTESGTLLVKDIRPGLAAAYPVGIVNANGIAYFSADNGQSGRELWKSDGTSLGTALVKDIRPGAASSFSIPLADVGGALYIHANDGTHGRELWKSNGTAGGTLLLKDIRPGAVGSSPLYGTEVNGALYFIADDGVYGGELWKSDGTSTGTKLLKDVFSGFSRSYVSELVNVNGTLYFAATDGIHGKELWKSDGTETGTVMVKDIIPGSGFAGGAPVVEKLVNVNGRLYFSANDGIHGEELWTSDGTPDGTKMVFDLTGDSGGSAPRVIAELDNGKLLVLAATAQYGRELYLLQLPSSDSEIVGSHVYHARSSFVGSGLENALDTSKQLAREGTQLAELTYDNLINSSRGINGLVFDIDSLPNTSLTASDFQFQWSPQGAFLEADHLPTNWQLATEPSSITVLRGELDRVIIEWPDNAIANRWLRVTVKASPNTGLGASEVYYIGHLRGETTGPSDSVFTVSFADITPIRSAVGSTVNASSVVDIDKNGTVAFADISAMRPNVSAQLTIITIPASATSGSQTLLSGGLNDDRAMNSGLNPSSLGLSPYQMAPQPVVHRSDDTSRRSERVDSAYRELGFALSDRIGTSGTKQLGSQLSTSAIDWFYRSMAEDSELLSLHASKAKESDKLFKSFEDLGDLVVEVR